MSENIKITEKTTISTLLDCAKEEIKNLKKGETFLVKDLFKGYEWSRITRANRIKLGSYFFMFASDNKKLIKVGEKNAQNQQLYTKA